MGPNPTVVALKLLERLIAMKASDGSQSNRSGFETSYTLERGRGAILSQSNRSGFETSGTAGRRRHRPRSQSNRSGFETRHRGQAGLRLIRPNPTVVALKPDRNKIFNRVIAPSQSNRSGFETPFY